MLSDLSAEQRHARIASDIRDFAFGMMRFQAEQFRMERPLQLRPIPADIHEREFVKAMRQDGLIPEELPLNTGANP